MYFWQKIAQYVVVCEFNDFFFHKILGYAAEDREHDNEDNAENNASKEKKKSKEAKAPTKDLEKLSMNSDSDIEGKKNSS